MGWQSDTALHIWVMPSSSLGWTLVIFTKVLCGFPQYLQTNSGIVPQSDHDCFLQNPFIIHLLSCHAMLWRLPTDRIIRYPQKSCALGWDWKWISPQTPVTTQYWSQWQYCCYMSVFPTAGTVAHVMAIIQMLTLWSPNVPLSKDSLKGYSLVHCALVTNPHKKDLFIRSIPCASEAPQFSVSLYIPWKPSHLW
jgi:hypothetical protein